VKNGLATLAIAALLLIGAVVLLNRNQIAVEAGAVGTSGRTSPVASARPVDTAVIDAPGVIREIETITGAVDGLELIGRTVDLHAPVGDVATPMAFWAGAGDNRVLVVLRQDNAIAVDRLDHGRYGRLAVHRGQQASIAGSVQRLPHPAEVASWKLRAADAMELSDRRIYVRADAVSADGHGHAND
jgi:hypothetical protein